MAADESSVTTFMNAERVTLDTNILVYAVDRDAGERHGMAADLVMQAAGWDCVLTLQALGEFFWATTRKGKMPIADAAAQVADWKALFSVQTASLSTLDRAIAGVREHRLSYWDAMLWSCAREAGCTLLLTEDFQHGQTLGGVRFHNPFRESVAIEN